MLDLKLNLSFRASLSDIPPFEKKKKKKKKQQTVNPVEDFFHLLKKKEMTADLRKHSKERVKAIQRQQRRNQRKNKKVYEKREKDDTFDKILKNITEGTSKN